MPAYPFNPQALHWNPPRPNRAGSFYPTGRLTQHGKPYVRNPRGWSATKTLSARVVVGFNVGTDPTYTMEDLIPIVRRIREEQIGNPSSTYVAQKGIYKHHGNGPTVEEDGAQVFIINTDGATMEEFVDQMEVMAEEIASELQQEEVILEIQENGISLETMGVVPQ
jgi:hypothetical protein